MSPNGRYTLSQSPFADSQEDQWEEIHGDTVELVTRIHTRPLDFREAKRDWSQRLLMPVAARPTAVAAPMARRAGRHAPRTYRVRPPQLEPLSASALRKSTVSGKPTGVLAVKSS